MYHTDRSGKGGGEVALYVRKSIQYKMLNKMCITIDDALECISVQISFRK